MVEFENDKQLLQQRNDKQKQIFMDWILENDLFIEFVLGGE